MSKDDFKKKEKKIWSRVPDGGLTQRKTGQPNIGRKITLILTFTRLCGKILPSHLLYAEDGVDTFSET
jgi:hypothetical protein